MVAWAMLAAASASLCDEDTESAVSDEIDADTVDSQVVTNFDEFKVKEGVTLARFTTLSINAEAAYAAIVGLNTVFRGIPMGIGTPTEGNVAGINLGTMGITLDNPANAPPGSVTFTNATVISIDNGIATETTVTAPDSITVTPAGVLSLNPGA
jgi:hypothetical protein